MDPDTAVPVLGAYLKQVPITRPYFDITPDSPDEAFAEEASRHPASELTPPRPKPWPTAEPVRS